MDDNKRQGLISTGCTQTVVTRWVITRERTDINRVYTNTTYGTINASVFTIDLVKKKWGRIN
jgi:hypothetical protein